MSITSAYQFIKRVREDDALREQVARLRLTNTLHELVTLARTQGYDCDANDLQLAFRYDWSLRNIAYLQPSETDTA